MATGNCADHWLILHSQYRGQFNGRDLTRKTIVFPHNRHLRHILYPNGCKIWKGMKKGPNPNEKFPLQGYEKLCFLKNIVSHPQIEIGDHLL